MPTPVEEIKSRLDVVDVVQGYVRLQKAGVNYRALCPFHTEKTPSFFVSPSRQTWYCFGGCSTGGDLISFVQKIEGVEFREALKILADRAGIRLPADNPQARSEREKALGVLEEAAKFYESALAMPGGAAASDYLKSRGLTPETIKTFRLGYAPNDWRALLGHFTEIGFAPPDIEKAGLIVRKSDVDGQSSDASYYDRFRHRIMFPLFDLSGRVVGFTGRIMPDAPPETAGGKYVNTPQTLVFDKGKILYGLHATKTDIRRAGAAILVEGQMDFLMSYQAGTRNVVAVSGTAFTPWHLSILKRYSDELTFAFDMDVAGENATKRALTLAQGAGFNVRVIRLDAGKDAADLVRSEPAAWHAAVKNAVSLVSFYMSSAFGRHDAAAPEGKKAIANELLPVLTEIPHLVERAHWMGELAERLGVREDDLRAHVARLAAAAGSPRAQGARAPAAPSAATPKSRKERLLEEVALYVTAFPHLEEKLTGAIRDELIAHIQALRQRNDLQLKSEFLTATVPEAEAMLAVLIKELAMVGVREELTRLHTELRAQERAGRREGVDVLAKDVQLTTEQLNQTA